MGSDAGEMATELGGSIHEGLACARAAGPQSSKQAIRVAFEAWSDADILPP
jgi:hypothetical protein